MTGSLELGGPLLLVGGGKMGGALLTGWMERGVARDQVAVVDPNPDSLADMVAAAPARYDSLDDLPEGFRPGVILLAVKPQIMDAVMPAVAALDRSDALVISIAAGKTLGYFAGHLGDAGPIVRVMPNTPAAVGRGMSVLVANAAATEADRTLASALMAAVGETAWIDDEALIDPVTALSGGGPAYVFLLIECLAEAGAKAGLPADLAMRLARVTVAGAGELVHQSTEPAAQLRKNVTSPNGTTQEALAVLMAGDGIQPIFDRAIAAATRRSRELAG